MTGRLKMILAEAAHSVRASMSTTVAATMTVLVAMLVLGTTIGLGTWLLSYSDHIKQQLVIKVYFDTSPQATPQQGALQHRARVQPAPGLLRDPAEEGRLPGPSAGRAEAQAGGRRHDQRRGQDVAPGAEGRRDHLRRLPDRRDPASGRVDA